MPAGARAIQEVAQISSARGASSSPGCLCCPAIFGHTRARRASRARFCEPRPGLWG